MARCQVNRLAAVRHAQVKPSGRKFVLLALAMYANHDGTNAYPAIGTLARDCSMSPKQVRRHMQALEGQGLIVSTAPARPGRGATYRLDFAALAAITPAHGRESLPPMSHITPAHGSQPGNYRGKPG